ncbi:MAG: hypothetical protein JW795_22690 [Chitinivibrionales bacterium]|nr:hypothetical protein [Chitinivibrionales bacterium]
MKTFSIVSVNISATKGTVKKPVASIVLQRDLGVVGDGHAGSGKREVSLLAWEDIERMIQKGATVQCGDFAENITTRDIDLPSLPVGARLRIGAVELEVTQIGKECHKGCAIRDQIGDCIMPARGIFARVISEGEISNESVGTYGF